MATKFQPTTPPPSTSIRIPPAPRWGAEEDHQSYMPRKSARVSRRAPATQTPPPASSASLSTSRTSPRFSKRSTSANMASSTPQVSSPPTAAKRLAEGSPQIAGGRRVSGALNYGSTLSAATALGLPPPHSKTDKETQIAGLTRTNGMLPTPAKTPNKRPSMGTPGISAVARNLFPIRSESAEEAMPTPKKKGRKRYSGFTLDSFQSEDDSGQIQIYTDSHDRVPDVDLSPDNPFFDIPCTVPSEPSKRSSKRTKFIEPVDSNSESVGNPDQRGDGMYYVFRGKKIFREFQDEKEAESAEEVEPSLLQDDGVPETARRPLTRSSVKPRLLFPSAQRSNGRASKSKGKELLRSDVTEDEEEATTDIEEQVGATTPTDHMVGIVSTPKAPKHAPFTPPTTARATRSKDIDIGNSPSAHVTNDDEVESLQHRGTGGKISPFDKWQRTKSSIGGGKKREAVSVPPGAGASKRTRG